MNQIKQKRYTVDRNYQGKRNMHDRITKATAVVVIVASAAVGLTYHQSSADSQPAATVTPSPTATPTPTPTPTVTPAPATPAATQAPRAATPRPTVAPTTTPKVPAGGF